MSNLFSGAEAPENIPIKRSDTSSILRVVLGTGWVNQLTIKEANNLGIDLRRGIFYHHNTKHLNKNGVHVLANIDSGRWVRLSSANFDLINSGIEKNLSVAQVVEAASKNKKEFTKKLLENLIKFEILVQDCRIQFPEQSLFEVAFLITERCNLRCKHCALPFDKKVRHPDLPTHKVFEILDKLTENCPKEEVMITGGEPLLRKDIKEILRYAANVMKGKTKLQLQTNAVLLDKNMSRLINETVDRVHISMDGADEESCSKIRGPGVFSKIIEGIRNLKGTGFSDISTSFIMTKENVSSVDDYVKLNKQLGIQHILRTLVPIGRGKTHWEELGLEENQDLGEKSKASKKYKEYSRGELKRGARNALRPKNGCGAGLRVLAVFPDGSIYPCPSFYEPKFRLGNIFENGLLRDRIKVWQGEGRLDAYDVDRRAPCKDCSVRYFCDMCPAENLGKYGSLEVQLEHCAEERKKLEELVYGE